MRTELSVTESQLLKQARAAALKAYAPYSNFRVGAAVLTDAGIFTGCNIENASYGLSLCAERVALFSAVQAGATRAELLAVSCIDASPDTAVAGRMPCGACRQVMSEFMADDALAIVDGVGAWQLSELLPEPFRLK